MAATHKLAATAAAGYSINLVDQKLFINLKKMSNRLLLQQNILDNVARERISTVAAAVGTCFIDLFCSVPMSNFASTLSAQPKTNLRDVKWFTMTSMGLVLAGNFCFIPLFYCCQYLIQRLGCFEGRGNSIFSTVVACLIANIPLTVFDTYRTISVTGLGDLEDRKSVAYRILEAYVMGIISFILVGVVRGIDLHRASQEPVIEYDDIEMQRQG